MTRYLCPTCRDTGRVWEPSQRPGHSGRWQACLDCYDAEAAARGHQERIAQNLRDKNRADELRREYQ